jgi:hypothetical protein
MGATKGKSRRNANVYLHRDNPTTLEGSSDSITQPTPRTKDVAMSGTTFCSHAMSLAERREDLERAFSVDPIAEIGMAGVLVETYEENQYDNDGNIVDRITVVRCRYGSKGTEVLVEPNEVNLFGTRLRAEIAAAERAFKRLSNYVRPLN